MSPLYRHRSWLAAGHALAALALLAVAPVPHLEPARIPEQQLMQLTLEDLPEEPPPPAPPKPAEPVPPSPVSPPRPISPPRQIEQPVPPKPKPLPRVSQPALAPNATQQVDQPVEAVSAATSQTMPAPAEAQPPVPPPAPAGPVAKTPEEIYLAELHQYLETIKRYPTSREARLERSSGEATVWFVLDRQGGLVDAGIEHSSGSMLLDQAALSTVRRGEYRTFPAELWPGKTEHRFVARLNFTLER